MVDEAAIFAEVTRRNALRCDAKLPALDVRAEVAHAVAIAAWREGCAAHADDLARITLEEEAAFHQRHGPGMSVGGRWLIHFAIHRRFCDLMAQHGYQPPNTRNAVTYGQLTV